MGKMNAEKRKRRKIRVADRIREQKTFKIVKEIISLLEKKDPKFKRMAEEVRANAQNLINAGEISQK